jgi:DNA-binding NarL/FixJ family response regulator
MEAETNAAARTRPTSSARPLVAVAGPNCVVRSWITQALAADGLRIVGVIADAPGLSRESVDVVPDVVVAGCTDGVGFTDAFVRRLTRAFPDVRIVVVTSPARAGELMRGAMRARVDAVVLASNIQRGLTPAVRAAYADEVVFPRCERRHAGSAALSFREKQVLRLAVHGHTNDEIAEELVLATSTVKSHLTSAFAKLCVRSRIEAAALLLNPENAPSRALLGLVSEPPQPIRHGGER